MRNNTNPQAPSDIFGNKFRITLANSPYISPIQIRHSPFFNGTDAFSGSAQELPFFILEHEHNQDHQNESSSQNHELPPQQEQISESFKEPIVPITENNMLEIVLRSVKKENQKMCEEYVANVQGGDFHRKLFEYLWQKFFKLKKTKEQMVKYCIRKSFKHITSKMRGQNRLAYANMENNEVVSQYFNMHHGDDQGVSMPFQPTSIEKTMNTNFLKKIFKCKKYSEDYNEFLKYFPQELVNDNKKKIKSMNESLKKVIKTKCFKALDDYKRLPWTYQILDRIQEFACKLREHAPSNFYTEKKIAQSQLNIQEENQGAKPAQTSVPLVNRSNFQESSQVSSL